MQNVVNQASLDEMRSIWAKIASDTTFGGQISERHMDTAVTLLHNQALATKSGTILSEQFGDTSTNISNNLGGVNSPALPTNTTNAIAGFDPIMVTMVRRALPKLMPLDVCGVVPMTAPTGLVFAARPRYIPTAPSADQNVEDQAFYNEADTSFSGKGTHSLPYDPFTVTTGTPLSTSEGEALGTNGNPFKEMGMTIEKIGVTAGTRGLKTSLSQELITDLRAVHNMDAQSVLSGILEGEMVAEINRQFIRMIAHIAKVGSQQTDITTAGSFDLNVDSNGRWSTEKWKGLIFQIEREANQIAKETRLGKGNKVICDSDTASALAMSGMMSYPTGMSTDLVVDDTGNLFAGVLNGKYAIYVDPYATTNFIIVCYRGTDPTHFGLAFAPYVPLYLQSMPDPFTGGMKIFAKTRYGAVANPFAKGLERFSSADGIEANTNVFYRKSRILNLTGTAIG